MNDHDDHTATPSESLQLFEDIVRRARPGEAVQVPSETIDTVLAHRNAIHGDFTEDATMAQCLKDMMRTSKNWDVLPPIHREALEQMQTKIARILSGDFNHPDHWKDLQGYPRLVEKRL